MNDFTLTDSQLPDGQFAYIVASRTQGFVPNPNNSAGNLCVVDSLARLNAPGQVGQTANGQFSFQVPLDDIPEPPRFNTVVMAGETWNFQLWHRDFGATGSTSNFAEALEVLFERFEWVSPVHRNLAWLIHQDSLQNAGPAALGSLQAIRG